MKIKLSKSQWEEMGRKAGWSIGSLGEDTVSCLICKRPIKMTGTKLCDRCWEVVNYIKDPKQASDKESTYRSTDELIKGKAKELIGKGVV